MPISITGLFTPSGGADAFDLLTWHDCDNHNWAATTAPGIDNDINDTAVATGGYVVGSLWIDTTADKAYICLDNTNHAAVWTEITGAGGGTVATDAIWDAKGDLAVGTGANTAAALTVGANDTILMAQSGETTGLKWVAAAAAGNIDGVQAAAEGTADTYARSDHAHRIQHAIADNAILTVDQADAADNDYAKFTAGGIEGRSYTEVKQDLDLEDADITTLAKTVKLDDLTAPDANTDLNASSTAHGLMIAAVDPASAVQRHVACTDNGETIWKAADLFDATHPEVLGTATEGTSLLAAHRDHVHTMPTLDGVAAPTDVTTLDVSTTAHGLAPKAVAPAAGLLNVFGIANTETAITNKALFDATVPGTIAESAAAAAGTAMAAARRDHTHGAPATYAATAHGPSKHTEGTAWRLIYLNASGDETEIVLGADGTFLESNGASAAPAFRALVHGDVATTSMTQSIMLTAGAGRPTTTSGCAAVAVVEAGTNKVDRCALAFDQTSDEYAFWGPIPTPDNWDASTLTAVFYWDCAAGVGGASKTVCWSIQMIALDNDDAIDRAWGTAVTVTDTWTADATLHESAASAAITPATTVTRQAGDLLFVRVMRDVSEDDMAGDARLIGVRLEYGISSLSA